MLESGGRFVFSILHPCFPAGEHVSGSWPTEGSYYDEGWWQAAGQLSSLRRQVGANHAIAEPAPSADWTAARRDAACFPVFLAARFRRLQSCDDAAPGS